MRANQLHPVYQAYLLRLWRDSEQTPWRVSLQAPGATEMHHFADLTRLFAFLNETTDAAHGHPVDPFASRTRSTTLVE